MRNRPSERRQAQLEEDAKDLAETSGGRPPRVCRWLRGKGNRHRRVPRFGQGITPQGKILVGVEKRAQLAAVLWTPFADWQQRHPPERCPYRGATGAFSAGFLVMRDLPQLTGAASSRWRRDFRRKAWSGSRRRG
jgi:hypothetical protein